MALGPCEQCRQGVKLDFEFSMAFQPIVNCQSKSIFGYEALVRGINNESAGSIIAKVTDDNRYAFDQACRMQAIKLAAKLGIQGMLSINFLPNAVYEPSRCIRATLEAAKEFKFPTQQIMFEFTESEKITDAAHVKAIVEYYRGKGFLTAIDDFGAGYAGLNLLAAFQPNIVKMDMELVHGIAGNQRKKVIAKHTINMLNELGVQVLVEGIETAEEYEFFRDQGIALMQGYYFAKPAFESLPTVPHSLF
ncbi:FOG: EAL domain protein [Pseudoalteromonas luteoviolacea B = ATCC 29581]|nr:FOG: EAL domain protein [Pseudoalteromonas luteoviolacea B = ATCC 29581]